MPRNSYGSIRQRKVKGGGIGKEEYRYDVRLDRGRDPETGQRRRRKKTCRTHNEARAVLAQWLREEAEGHLVTPRRDTVADVLWAWYNAGVPTWRPATVWIYRHTIEHHILPVLGSIPVQKLTAERVQRFYDGLVRAGCGARTIECCHGRLNQALKRAARLSIVGRNVCEMVTVPGRTTKRRDAGKTHRAWTESEAVRFLEVADRDHYAPLWRVALETGMRRGELLGLRWVDITWADDGREYGQLRVEQTITSVGGRRLFGDPKTDSSRRAIPAHRDLLTALKIHKARQNERRLAAGPAWEDHDLVFCTRDGRPISPRNIHRSLERLCTEAGVPRLPVHGARHTFISHAIRAGADVKAVAEVVGHKRTSVTLDVYTHTTDSQREATVARATAALRHPTEGRE